MVIRRSGTSGVTAELSGRRISTSASYRTSFLGVGDDRVTSWAFDSRRNPLGARLNAIYGSDLGHYDLIDMRDAAVEAYEGVEQGLMTEEDFCDFVFTNPIKLHCGMNPDFFKGTVVEDSAARVVAELIGPV